MSRALTSGSSVGTGGFTEVEAAGPDGPDVARRPTLAAAIEMTTTDRTSQGFQLREAGFGGTGRTVAEG